MSSTLKISLLALASTVAAVPQYGYGHSKFHNSLKPSGTGHPHAPYGTGKPYPTGGSGYNTTVAATQVPYPTDGYPAGSGYGQDQTIEETTTATTTVYSTVHVKASAAAASGSYEAATSPAVQAQEAPVANNDYCGVQSTVTVYETAKDKVTVTVTPSAAAPSVYEPAAPSSVAPVESKAEAYAVPTTPAYQAPASSAAPAPSASAPAPSTGNSYSGVKRGLSYNDAAVCSKIAQEGSYGFAYNWGQVENNNIGTAFIPMMHGPSKSSVDEWLANVDKAVKKGSTAVMGFNECDHAEQCNLSPEAACSAWKEYMNPIKAKYPQVTIVGPSVTNGPAPMGLDWLTRFHSACPDAVVDATNIHFYDIYEDATIDRFKAQVEKASAIHGKVWITELGLNPGSASTDQAATFLKEVMSYCDGSDNVQGYSWFKADGGDYGLTNPSLAALYASA